MLTLDLTPHICIVSLLAALLCIIHVDATKHVDLAGICFEHARKPANLCTQHWMNDTQKHSCLLVQRDWDSRCSGLTSENSVDRYNVNNDTRYRT